MSNLGFTAVGVVVGVLLCVLWVVVKSLRAHLAEKAAEKREEDISALRDLVAREVFAVLRALNTAKGEPDKNVLEDHFLEDYFGNIHPPYSNAAIQLCLRHVSRAVTVSWRVEPLHLGETLGWLGYRLNRNNPNVYRVEAFIDSITEELTGYIFGVVDR